MEKRKTAEHISALIATDVGLGEIIALEIAGFQGYAPSVRTQAEGRYCLFGWGTASPGAAPFHVGRAFAEGVSYPTEVLNRVPSISVEAFTGVSNVSVFADP